jgi:DnaJ-class molecular chaperone
MKKTQCKTCNGEVDRRGQQCDFCRDAGEAMRDEKKVRIIIAGRAGTGKSTILQIIGQALADAGIEANVIPVDHEYPHVVDPATQKKRVQALAKVKVDLEERHMYANLEGGYNIMGLRDTNPEVVFDLLRPAGTVTGRVSGSRSKPTKA